MGGSGNDTYLFMRGDGQDVIFEEDTTDIDSLNFAAGILAADVTAVRQPNGDLLLQINGTLDSVTVKGWFIDPALRLNTIRFGDGALLNLATLASLAVAPIFGTAGDDVLKGSLLQEDIRGGAGNDFLDGGRGDDILQGEAGADSYLLALDIGRDTVIDNPTELSTILLGPGVAQSDIATRREGNNLFVYIAGTPDGLLLKDYYLAAQNWTVKDSGGVSVALSAIRFGSSPDDMVRAAWNRFRTDAAATSSLAYQVVTQTSDAARIERVSAEYNTTSTTIYIKPPSPTIIMASAGGSSSFRPISYKEFRAQFNLSDPSGWSQNALTLPRETQVSNDAVEKPDSEHPIQFWVEVFCTMRLLPFFLSKLLN